jgi:BirA family transcriptional regulator, biotin operon repressor / biotin---[acetyl-CoA-carboxylase] ligase
MIIGSNLIFIDNLTSTNNYALALIRKNPPAEGTIVYTNYQKGGRGQKGNHWESERGKNLLISIILYPSAVSPPDQFIISKAISLGICDFLIEYARNVYIKWPNDIYVENDKIAGILIESSVIAGKIENTIAGIGININQINFSNYSPNPVSLSLLTGRTYDPFDCLKKVSYFLDKRYKQLVDRKYTEIDSDYLLKLYRYREWHKFKDINKTYTGRIISLTQSGLLQIEEQNGLINEYSFKEVDFSH